VSGAGDAEPPVVDVGWSLYDDDHEALRGQVRVWVAEALAPNALAWEAAGSFPRSVFADAGAAGLFGWKMAPTVGGRGPDFLADAVVTEELAACGSAGVAAALGAHKDLGPYYVWRFGTDEQRRRWVTPALTGEAVGALGVTEPGAGSDVAGIRTRAVRDGDDWVLDGTKTFITNGTWADFVVVAAVTDPDAGGHHGQSLFVVEAGDRGFTSTRIKTLGWRTSHTAELAFTGVRLPADRVLGGPDQVGQGFACIMRNFQWERIVMALAASRGAADILRAGVGLVGDTARPDLQAALGEIATDVAAARRLTEHALRCYVHGQDAVREVSMAKWYACEVAQRTCTVVAGVLGPTGGGQPWLERAIRDNRLGPIGGGTTEIMKEVIGRGYGL
jgi:acyl-CoA dehydrogenase